MTNQESNNALLAWFVYSQSEEALRKRNPGPQMNDLKKINPTINHI